MGVVPRQRGTKRVSHDLRTLANYPLHEPPARESTIRETESRWWTTHSDPVGGSKAKSTPSQSTTWSAGIVPTASTWPADETWENVASLDSWTADTQIPPAPSPTSGPVQQKARTSTGPPMAPVDASSRTTPSSPARSHTVSPQTTGFHEEPGNLIVETSPPDGSIWYSVSTSIGPRAFRALPRTHTDPPARKTQWAQVASISMGSPTR